MKVVISYRDPSLVASTDFLAILRDSHKRMISREVVISIETSICGPDV